MGEVRNMPREISVEEMKQLQVQIMQAVDTFCQENNLTYFLFSGTLIGAARHKGYIPWDDDVDICMKREDYDRFFQLFNASQQGRYRAICFENAPGYYLASGKVIDTNTVMKENTESPFEIGVYIDIFPMDYIPSNEAQYKKMNAAIGRYRGMLMLKNLTKRKGRSVVKSVALVCGKFLLKPVSRAYILNQISTLARKYVHNHDNTFNLADISVYTYGKRELFPLSDFASATELEFEEKKWSAPIGYDHVLSSMYGDYMKLPPKEKQVSHHDYKVYWREETK